MKRSFEDKKDVLEAGDAPSWGTKDALGAIFRLRAAMAAVVEGLIDLLDKIEVEVDGEVGIEDLPHDQVDEGNDEPSLGSSEAGSYASRAWCVDGEIDETEAA